MIEIVPHARTDLTGPWAGFSFQAGHMFPPEGQQLEPCDMAWWSPTCNIAREWRLMMAEARIDLAERSAPASTGSATAKSGVIYLAEVLRIRRERRLAGCGPGSDAESSNVVYISRGPRQGDSARWLLAADSCRI
ncbi:hypothetical protein CEE55_03140 [Stenotrophomonas pavanii]|uniref:Uncharacterized protein n=1 Tax=Stenotrophomonas pavanii TaxID=487698 RepID=A0A246L2K9_9GAMM|nr:hypothetical protein [Stenotrophomonas pavanii]OWR35101.1 hypothetical protein CEE55_03140 [Stenotrophomonas pavanii]